ncbi:MAG TPA: hypothetical protein VI756_00615 [Blastocatellia bacterium]
MMKRGLFTGVVIAAALCLCAIAVLAAGHDFSGTWKLDKTNSKLSGRMANIEGMTMTVTQDANQITVATKVEGMGGGGPRGDGGQGGAGGAGGAGGGGGQGGGGGRRMGGGGGMGGGMGQPMTFKLDGSETTMDVGGRNPGKATLKAQWHNDMLETSQERNLNFNGNDVTITTKEKWAITPDGKTLTIERTMDTPRGSEESTLVFTKQ